MNTGRDFMKAWAIDLAIAGGLYAFVLARRAMEERKIKKELKKELEHLKREAEKGVVDVEDYVVYPA